MTEKFNRIDILMLMNNELLYFFDELLSGNH